jgi:hypothetical protein
MHTNNKTLAQYKKKWNHCIKCARASLHMLMSFGCDSCLKCFARKASFTNYQLRRYQTKSWKNEEKNIPHNYDVLF